MALSETQEKPQEETAPHVPVPYTEELVFNIPGTHHAALLLIGAETSLLGQICKYPNDKIINNYVGSILAVYKAYPPPDNFPSEKLALLPEEKEEAERVLDFARALLHSLYEHKGYTKAQGDRFFELLKRHMPVIVATADEQGIVRVGQMGLMGSGGIYSTFCVAVMNFLSPVVLRDDWRLLLQCPACKTLFVRDKQRPTQKYDCHTCQNNDAARRQYEKKKRKI